MAPFLVDVILSCNSAISEAKVGWYPTAEGILPSKVETSEPACENLKILSIKSKTFFFSSSLKYSAIVKADKATLALAPGTSFICPKTKAVLFITPDSFISLCKSFPSLVLSPTPANTETPPDSSATFLISSCKKTVFPTPAPPNNPTFPPLINGAIKSTTLIPVSKISVFVVCSVKAGEALCIGQCFSNFIRPEEPFGDEGFLASLKTFPQTSNKFPKTSCPTGTKIWFPVSSTSTPL